MSFSVGASFRMCSMFGNQPKFLFFSPNLGFPIGEIGEIDDLKGFFFIHPTFTPNEEIIPIEDFETLIFMPELKICSKTMSRLQICPQKIYSETIRHRWYQAGSKYW